MDTELLATRLRIPPPVRHAIARPRLLDALERGVPEARLALVSAPAGYGKTTLLSQWAHATSLPVAWLTVDESDRDANHFLRYLLEAWASIQPEIRESMAGVLLGGVEPDRDQVLAAFVNAANDLPGHAALVIDDAHQLDDPAILAALTFLLNNLPQTCHVVLAGRGDPPLALARLRARGELLELRGEDLQFETGEARRLLGDGMGLQLEEDEVAALNTDLEGWATGLQLVGLTIRQRPVPGDIVLGSGRHRHVADYLTEEVLGHLPDETRAFLFQTSILDRLNHSLCVAVTGNERSQEMLESLERANLFLMPLDADRTWFRYHRVFADFLQHGLRQRAENTDALHSRAAAWYLEHALPDQAFRHALKGADIDLVSQVLEGYVAPMMFSGEVGVVVGWFDALPESWLANRPELMIMQAAFLLLTGQPAAAVHIMEHLEQAPAPDDPGGRRAVARTNALRCFMACIRNDLPEALTHATRAFQQLPPEDVAFRANIFHALGDTYRSNRQWNEARANYLKVLEWASQAGQHPTIRIITVHSYSALADLELRRGRLRSAQEYWIRALESIQQRKTWEHYPLPVSGWIHLRLGELAHERNDLEQARDYVTRGLERAELGGEPQALIAGRVIMARLELADGRPDSAEALLAGAERLLDDSSFADWLGPFERCRLSLWQAQSNHRAIAAWVDARLGSEGSGARTVGDDADLALVALLLRKRDAASLERAGGLLQQIVPTAQEHDLLGVLVEALTLRAMAHEQRGDMPAMLGDLEQALRLAEPEGYVRLFVDLGLPLGRILQEARDRGVMPAYVSRLLAAFGGDPGTALTGTPVLVEPLSARELDVLRLIATGLSNREIAGELFVSPETVKKHTGNIYGKLGVRGRIEAVTRARALSIID